MSWKAEYAILIFTSTVVDYFAAIWIYKQKKKKIKIALLLISLIANLGLLFTFKYSAFFTENFNYITHSIGLNFEIPYYQFLLPIGISFYTFQTLSYTIDVFRCKTTPEKHFGKFAVYVSFWPQLVAGPIERSYRLQPQLNREHKLDYDNVRIGLTQMAYGFFKKMVIADRLAVYVDQVFGNVESFSTIPLIIAVLFFAVQIYADFPDILISLLVQQRLWGFN